MIRLRAVVASFPGSNCVEDTVRWLLPRFETVTVVHSHKVGIDEIKALNQCDFIVIPGGFAYGDRKYDTVTGDYIISPGSMASASKLMDQIKTAVECSFPTVLGICNGFQILVHAGLLGGRLEENHSPLKTPGTFVCQKNSEGMLTGGVFAGSSIEGVYIQLPVAHGYGRYIQDINDKDTVPFCYYADSTINSSHNRIAGVRNGYVYGMMPHPERSSYAPQILDAFVQEFLNGY